MTDLRIQTLTIRNCEERIVRGYYDWGRGWPADAIVPIWDNAPDETRSLVARRGYSLYDGWPPVSDNEIGALEAYVSVGISSQVLVFDVLRLMDRADGARKWLELIPADMSLHTASDEAIAAAGALVDHLSKANHIGFGKATKILHKKRPHLIPVVDSVVWDFFFRNFPYVQGLGSTFEIVLQIYRDVVRSRMKSLMTIQEDVSACGFPLSLVRILSHLIWQCWQEDKDKCWQPINKVWNTKTLPAARTLARESWINQGE